MRNSREADIGPDYYLLLAKVSFHFKIQNMEKLSSNIFMTTFKTIIREIYFNKSWRESREC